MSDRRLSEVLGCQDHDLPLVDNVAPAYAYREAEDELNNEDRYIGLAILVVVLIVIFGVAWASVGVRDAMTREEIKREGR